MDKLENYRIHQDRINTGDLIEFASSSLLGYAIRWFTKKDVNHTSTVIRYIVQGDITPRRFVFEALENGYIANFLSIRLENFKGKVYWMPLKIDYGLYRVGIAKVAHEFLGRKYDFKSLFKNAFGRVSSDARELFCSEAADEEMRQVGLLPWDYNDSKRLRPGEFYKTGLFEKRIRIL